MKLLYLEFYKTRRRKVGLSVAAMVAVELLWSLWALSRMDAADLQQGWQYFLYQAPMIDAVVMPMVCAMVASRIADTEHKGQMLKLLETVQSAGRLYDAKMLCGTLYLLAAAAVQAGMFVIAGMVYGFAGTVPVEQYALLLLSTSITAFVALALQQGLSLLIPNQMIAMAVGVFGSFAGLFSLFFPRSLQKCVLWSYYGVLSTVGMNWERETRLVQFYDVPFDWAGFALLLLFGTIIYLVGRTKFVRKEAA